MLEKPCRATIDFNLWTGLLPDANGVRKCIFYNSFMSVSLGGNNQVVARQCEWKRSLFLLCELSPPSIERRYGWQDFLFGFYLNVGMQVCARS